LSLFPRFDALCNDDEKDLWELEPSWGKAALFFRTGWRFGHPPGSNRCRSLIEVNRHLGVFKRRFEAGDTLSLLHAVGLCAEENLPLPTWLALAYQQQLSSFLSPGKVVSLDDVFSSKSLPTNSAKKAATVRQDWQLGISLLDSAWTLARSDASLSSFDKAIAAALKAGNYGIGKTKAKELIALIEHNQSEHLGRNVSLSQFLEKRRKQST